MRLVAIFMLKNTTNLALARDISTTYRVLVSSTAVLIRIQTYRTKLLKKSSKKKSMI